MLLVIGRINNIEINENNLDFYRRSNLLNQKPILTARHFQYRVDVCFKEILLDKKSHLGKVENYVINVELQFRGSPHVHCLLWILNSPLLSTNTKEKYTKFVDNIVRTDLPDKAPELQNGPCCFHYVRYFTEKTIFAELLAEEMPKLKRLVILSSRTNLLKKVKVFIDENFDPNKATYNKPMSIVDIVVFRNNRIAVRCTFHFFRWGLRNSLP